MGFARTPGELGYDVRRSRQADEGCSQVESRRVAGNSYDGVHPAAVGLHGPGDGEWFGRQGNRSYREAQQQGCFSHWPVAGGGIGCHR